MTASALVAPLRVVLFDLDGTLVDTAPDLAESLAALCRSLNQPMPDFEGWSRRVPEGAKAMIEYALGPQPKEQLERHLEFFLAHYRQHCFVHSQIFPGVQEMLKGLRALGLSLAVVTNKQLGLAESVLSQSGLSPYFECVIGGDSTPAPKPAPQPVLMACELLGQSVENALLVGDDERDCLAASRAGTRFLFAGWGYSQLSSSVPELEMLESATDLIPRCKREAWL